VFLSIAARMAAPTVADIEAARKVVTVASVQNLYNLQDRRAEAVLDLWDVYRGQFWKVAPRQASIAAEARASVPEAVAEAVVEDLPEPVTDHHAGARYRRRMIRLLLQRHLRSLA